MIIAGFSGIGKTTFCQKVENAVDFGCMTFKYSNFDKLLASGRPVESFKASLELDFIFGWEFSYLEAILEYHRQNPQDYLVIPSVARVLRCLGQAGVPYVLCYPETGARQEYLRRFKSRGNSPDFIDIFIGDWDNWMESLRKDSWGIHIEMKPHQYLLDLKDQIDRLAPLTSTLPPDPRSAAAPGAPI